MPQKRSATVEIKISKAFGALTGLRGGNGNMVALRWLFFPSKAAWKMKRLKRLSRKPL